MNEFGTVFNEAMRAIDFLSIEEEYRLIGLWQTNKDQQALQKLLLAHSRFAFKYARKYAHRAPLTDLVQEANIGMVVAATSFDLSRDLRFSTYAVWGIKTCIKEYLKHMSFPISVSGNGGYRLATIEYGRRLIEKTDPKLAEDPNLMLDALVKMSKLSLVIVKDVVSLLDAKFKSKDAVVAGTHPNESWGAPAQDTLADPSDLASEISTHFDNDRYRIALYNAIDKLHPRLRLIMREHYGLDTDGKKMTLSELAPLLGVSRQRVQQMERKGLKQLKELLSGDPIGMDLVVA